MILTNLPDEVLIIHPATVLDEYGNPTVDFNEDSDVDSTKGWLQSERGTGGENKDAERNSSSAFFRLYLPAGTVIGPRDQVQIESTTYTVEGEPVVGRNLRTKTHIQARVRKLEG